MAQTSGSALPGRAPDPYVSTSRQRRALGPTAAVVAAVYLSATTIAGPTVVGRVLDSSIMAAAALLSSALAVGYYRRVNEAVKLPWAAFGVGVGLYSAVFVMQAARWAGWCDRCGPPAAAAAVAAWTALSFVLWGALRLAYREADLRLWTIEILDAVVVLVAAALGLALLVELGSIAVPHPFASVEFVELMGLPLAATGLVFATRSISPQIFRFKVLQSVFLTAVAVWILARSWNAGSYGEIAWVVFVSARATAIACAIFIPAYGVSPRVRVDILNVRGPEDRPVTDVSVVVCVLAILVVIARLFADPAGVVHEVALPVLAGVALLLVVRLALTSEYHKHLEDVVTDSSARYRELVEKATQGILEIDVYGVVRYSNDAAAQIMGVEREDLLGRDIADLLEPLSEANPAPEREGGGHRDAAVGLLARLRAGSRVVARLPDPDGGSRYVELAASPSGGQGPLKTLLRDVTVEVERRMRVENLIGNLRAKDVERSALMREMLETVESERYSIASQLHDGPVQHLTLLALKTDLLRKKASGTAPDEFRSACSEIADEVRSEAVNLRELSNALSPSVRPDVDLEASFNGLMRNLFSSGGAAGPVAWRVTAPQDIPCTTTAKIALYRSLQAIALDARVSGASRAELELAVKDTVVSARFITDAPLDNARSRGVARAKVWTVRIGGTFSERRRGPLYEAELQIPPSAEVPA